MKPFHLLRRLFESILARRVSEHDLRWVSESLTQGEFALWSSMQVMDQTHSIGVARRLVDHFPQAERIEIAAALLHDVGKSRSSLGVPGRIMATIFGPRTKRWFEYHEHEQIGADMCRSSEIDESICDLIAGRGSVETIQRLKRADDL